VGFLSNFDVHESTVVPDLVFLYYTADLDYPVLSGTSSSVGSSSNLVDYGPATGGRILMLRRRGGGRRLINSCGLGSNGCASNLSCCNNVGCVNTTSDSQHCGACNRPCAWDKVCCNGVCTNIWSADASNCGACGKWCGWKGATCLYGICNYNSA